MKAKHIKIDRVSFVSICISVVCLMFIGYAYGKSVRITRAEQAQAKIEASAQQVYESWRKEQIARLYQENLRLEIEIENAQLAAECEAQMAAEEGASDTDEALDGGTLSDVGEVAVVDTPQSVSDVSVSVTAPTGQVTQCDDRELLAKLLCREAGGEGWDCQVYTCSAILNHCDYEHISLNTAAHDPNHFNVWNVDGACPTQTTYDVVDHVLNGGRIPEIAYFQPGCYHSFGTPVIQVGAHYFSKP